jgi:hypothetical protein
MGQIFLKYFARLQLRRSNLDVPLIAMSGRKCRKDVLADVNACG